MLCRLASASSGMLHSVVNHCPSPPLDPGASLSLPDLRTQSSVFSGSSESELREKKPLCYIGHVRNVLPSQTYSYVPCLQHVLFFIFSGTERMLGKPREMPQENVTLMCMSDREDFWKHFFTKRDLWTTSCSSELDKWVWKNRSRTPEVCPSLSETMSNRRIIP